MSQHAQTTVREFPAANPVLELGVLAGRVAARGEAPVRLEQAATVHLLDERALTCAGYSPSSSWGAMKSRSSNEVIQ